MRPHITGQIFTIAVKKASTNITHEPKEEMENVYNELKRRVNQTSFNISTAIRAIESLVDATKSKFVATNLGAFTSFHDANMNTHHLGNTNIASVNSAPMSREEPKSLMASVSFPHAFPEDIIGTIIKH
ncbi:hypothetical protein Vi05172_g12566 [Venturia inaequalis]|nr:hypothetical protein Vi05172_g12566 [Venturia inaequalis]